MQAKYKYQLAMEVGQKVQKPKIIFCDQNSELKAYTLKQLLYAVHNFSDGQEVVDYIQQQMEELGGQWTVVRFNVDCGNARFGCILDTYLQVEYEGFLYKIFRTK